MHLSSRSGGSVSSRQTMLMHHFAVSGEDLEQIRDMIDAQISVKCNVDLVGIQLVAMYGPHIVYQVSGTEKDIAAVKRLIRRLARGKPRFTVKWYGIHLYS